MWLDDAAAAKKLFVQLTNNTYWTTQIHHTFDDFVHHPLFFVLRPHRSPAHGRPL